MMLHAAFGRPIWFLGNEYPGHVSWKPEHEPELPDLRKWWEARWNKSPLNSETCSEVLHLH